jgi:hypothetical protein
MKKGLLEDLKKLLELMTHELIVTIEKNKTKFISVLTSQEMKEWTQKQKKPTKRRRGEGDMRRRRRTSVDYTKCFIING